MALSALAVSSYSRILGCCPRLTLNAAPLARNANAVSRPHASTPLILLAFVLFRWNHAIMDSISMKHRRGEIEEKEPKSPAGRCKRGKQNKNADRDRANHPENSHEDVSLINMSQTGHDTEHHCDSV